MSDVEQRTLSGGAIGACAGAIVGAIAGHTAWGAAIGAPAVISTTATRKLRKSNPARLQGQSAEPAEESVEESVEFSRDKGNSDTIP